MISPGTKTKKQSTTAQPKNLAATARAFATYSLVPYLGILFCPGAVLLGSLGFVRSYRSASGVSDNSRVACGWSVLVGFVIAVIQLLLWWILYKVPAWARSGV
ncbi:MAG TPA: hypothetical protein VLE19_03600 [Pyrinomonadaceae bacterium]|nr:hypothetical protein [Pyrinomonadaceae bacterium]